MRLKKSVSSFVNPDLRLTSFGINIYGEKKSSVALQFGLLASGLFDAEFKRQNVSKVFPRKLKEYNKRIDLLKVRFRDEQN